MSNQLTREQVGQLVNVVSQDAQASWMVLREKSGPKLSPEQQQKLVDAACKNVLYAAWTLNDVPWLTEPQRLQLQKAS